MSTASRVRVTGRRCVITTGLTLLTTLIRVMFLFQAAKKCFYERSSRGRATANFIVVDWAGRTHGVNKIGEVAKRRNVQNVKFFLKQEINSPQYKRQTKRSLKCLDEHCLMWIEPLDLPKAAFKQSFNWKIKHCENSADKLLLPLQSILVNMRAKPEYLPTFSRSLS